MHFRSFEVTDDPDNVLGILHSAARSMREFKRLREAEERAKAEAAEKERRKIRHLKLRRAGRLSPSEAREHALHNPRRASLEVNLSPRALSNEWLDSVRGGSLAERRLARVPPAFRVGVMRSGEAEVPEPRGIQVRGSRVRFGSLGALRVSKAIGRSLRSPARWRLGATGDGWPDGTVMLGYPGYVNRAGNTRKRAHAPTPPKSGEGSFKEFKKGWPALRFILTREPWDGEETLRRAAALDYIHANPGLPLRKIEALGFGGKDLELVADSHDALRPLLQQVTKSRDNDILSPRWFYRLRREQREVSMPDSLDGYDDSGGDRPVAGQAFEAQVFEALHASPVGGFFG